MKAGFSKRDITPPLTIELDGYAPRNQYPVGVHDPIYVRSLAVTEDSTRLVILSLDLLGLEKPWVDRIKQEIHRDLGIPFENIIVSTTHTHSAPSTGIFRPTNHSWMENLVEHCLSATIEAFRKERPVRYGASIGNVVGININRRNIRGPVDTSVPVLRLETERGVVATLYSFACHAVVLGPNNYYISADYPGASNRLIESYDECGALFLQGASGDINPLVPSTKLTDVYNRGKGTFEEVERMGKILAAEVLKTSNLIYETKENAEIKCLQEGIELEIEEIPSPEKSWYEYRASRERKAKTSDYRELVKMGIAEMSNYRYFKLWQRLKDARKVVTVLQACKIDDLLIVTLPGEALVEIALDLKKRFDEWKLIVAAYAGDYLGYIPTVEELKKGGYETSLPWRILTEESIRRLIEKTFEIVEKLVTS